MHGLVPCIHVIAWKLSQRCVAVDGRNKSGHDGDALHATFFSIRLAKRSKR